MLDIGGPRNTVQLKYTEYGHYTRTSDIIDAITISGTYGLTWSTMLWRPGTFTVGLLLVVVSVFAGEGGKGSDSYSSSGEELESGSEGEDGSIQTGHQHKFWVPTYKGTNPLNRRKISITTSEIEKYDRSIDVSLSGVGKNRTRVRESSDSMPLIWNGDNIPRNSSEKSIELSLVSRDVTLESAEGRNSSGAINKKSLISKTKSHTPQSVREKQRTPNKLTTVKKRYSEISTMKNIKKSKYLEKEVTSQFFDELGKAKDNEARKTPEFYKRLAKDAVRNTENKLSSRRTIRPKYTRSPKRSRPEIIKVNLDSKSLEKPNMEDEIRFSTRHNQKQGQIQESEMKTGGNKGKDFRSQLKKERKIESIAKENGMNKTKSYTTDNRIHKTDIASREETSLLYNEDYSVRDDSNGEVGTEEEEEDDDEREKEEGEDSFTEFCDYSAWSDALARNKTVKKQKKKKPKQEVFAEKSSTEMRKWPGKEIKDKADKLRKKEGKVSRKKKRDRALKKRRNERKSMKSKAYDDYDYEKTSPKRTRKYEYDDNDYQKKGRARAEKYKDDYDYPEKKIRMRTEGEKRHAVKEVKAYLEKMDKQYGGRPGRDGKDKMAQEQRGRGREYERGGRFRNRERRKGRDYGYKRRNFEGDEVRRGRGGDRGRGRGRQDDWSRGRDRGYERRGRGGYGDREGGRSYRGSGRGRGNYNRGRRGNGRGERRGSRGRRD
ncbi:uncharacterized protein DDB_G0283697-like [Homalodisca vitripennis]|uniref:uncharacterized protein DDB_G0283697-like n=1 Tax=Homalodisca vitripennis TaxID=197043 RepID=UPI001EEA43B2|nr:uncharacterized protein DDB_G0283697-like [Homalodisca vitripennis]